MGIYTDENNKVVFNDLGEIHFRPISGFITEWTVSGDATARTITLPTYSGSTYNATIDWGDTTTNTLTTWNGTERTHTYTNDGVYNVEIRGVFRGWSFNNGGSRLKCTNIIYWGDKLVFEGFNYLLNGFYGCTNLKSGGNGKIPSYNGTINVQGLFRSCSNLEYIPNRLFDNFSTFSSGGFNFTFNGCNKLQRIPDNLFDVATGITGTTALANTFNGCSLITSIPTDLFRYNTGVTSFANCFTSCVNLLTIPYDLFRYNTLVTSFSSTFNTCTKLTAIPDDLFYYNTGVTSFSATFNSCSSLTTIPNNIFRYNTLATTFLATFGSCTNLTTMPANLFEYNVLCDNFSNTFRECVKLQMKSNVFYFNGEQSTRFLNQSVNFNSFFYLSTSFTGTQGEAPDLWNCNFGAGTPTKTDAFQGHSNASLLNYSDIPADWL